MKKFLVNALPVFVGVLLWIAFLVLVFTSAGCNSSKKFQSSSTIHDTTTLHVRDTVRLQKTSNSEENSNQRIWEMLFGLQQSINDKGQPVTKVYPTALKIIDNSTQKKSSETKDSSAGHNTDSTNGKKAEAAGSGSSSTEVFPKWWLAVAFIGGLSVALFFSKFQISKR